jgi:hypothetical protein
MNWLGKMFKKKKSYAKQDMFKLCIVDETSDSTHVVLGINEERMNELRRICDRAYEKNTKLTSAMDDILQECNHINEVVISMQIYNKLRELNSLEETLRKLTKYGF